MASAVAHFTPLNTSYTISTENDGRELPHIDNATSTLPLDELSANISKTETKPSSGTSQRTTRQLRSRTIVTTASTVQSRAKNSSKGRARNLTYTKSLSPSKPKVTRSLKEDTYNLQSTSIQKVFKGKSKEEKSKSKAISPPTVAEHCIHNTPKQTSVHPLVHQDTPGDATINQGDKLKTHHDPSSRVFRLSNPNSPASTVVTPKRLSILQLSFDKENTPPPSKLIESKNDNGIISKPPKIQSEKAEKLKTTKTTKTKTPKPARKSLLPKCSNGLRRVIANPSPSSPSSKRSGRSVASKLKKNIPVSKTDIATDPQQTDEWVSTDSDSSHGSTNLPIANINLLMSAKEKTDQVQRQIVFGKESSTNQLTVNNPAPKESKKSPIKFSQDVPPGLKKTSGAITPVSAPGAKVHSEPSSVSPSRLRKHPSVPGIHSEYSLASSACSPLLAAVLTRPLMQSCLYEERKVCQTCLCKSASIGSSMYMPTQANYRSFPGHPLSFLAEYSGHHRFSWVWPDEEPDREVERTTSLMSHHQPDSYRMDRLKNPIASTFCDEPSDEYHFHPIHVPTKVVIQKAGSAFNRIIVC